ncbi:MAG: hypothetical protein JKY56_04260, partial [Kofleriaceae bacterium]|nr:hypothetical protein [Kofleriaceae bacterium]
MPDDVDAIRRVTRRGRGSYAALNHSEAGRAFLNVRIEERYENPPSSTNGKIRTVEYDTAPGVLEEKRRNNWAVLHSRVTQGQSWKTEEVAAAFQRLGEKYSETVISARIRIPLGTNHRFWEYRWIRHQERIAVKRGDMPSRVWVADVPKGDWGPFIRGERSLQPEDMELQTL